MSSQRDLLTLVCERFNCPPEAFEQTMLQRSVSPVIWPLVRLIIRFRRDFYAFDLELIEDLKKATSFAEVSQIMASYCSLPRQRQVFKLILNARVSKRRLKNVARQLFSAIPA